MSSSATSKPSAFNRRTRPSIRCISPAVELLDVGQLGPQFAVAALDGLHQNQWVQGLVEQAAGLQVAELTVEVGAGDGEVVLPLAIGQLVVQLTGLGVDQVRGEGAGVASEQRVGQRHVAPEETDQVQPSQQHDHGVDQPVDRVLAYAAAEQRAVGQRELQVAGDQDRVQGLAVVVHPVGDHADRLNRGDLQPAQITEQPVLVQGEVLQHLLDGEHLLAAPDEPHHMPGDASRQGDQVVLRPVLQRGRPRQADQLGDRLGGQEPRHAHHSVLAGEVDQQHSAPRIAAEGRDSGARQRSRLTWSDEIRSPVCLENTCTCSGSIFSRTVSPRCGGVRPWIRAVIC